MLFVFDLDGTLLNSKKISESIIASLSIFNINFACIDAVPYTVIRLFSAVALTRFVIPEKN